MEVKSHYRDWVKNRLNDIGTIENEDFEGAEILAPSGQTVRDHIISLDTAKEMAMSERNEKGKQVRRYFIQVEKKYKTGVSGMMLTDKQLMALAVMEAQKTIAEQEQGAE